jgi:hypothetical protein
MATPESREDVELGAAPEPRPAPLRAQTADERELLLRRAEASRSHVSIGLRLPGSAGVNVVGIPRGCKAGAGSPSFELVVGSNRVRVVSWHRVERVTVIPPRREAETKPVKEESRW